MTDTDDAVAKHATRGEHENRYLAEVQRRLAHLPPGRRRELLSITADNLDERPPATSRAELEHVLGPPADYALELLDGSVPTPGRSKAEVRRIRRRRWQIAGITAVVLSAVGAGAAWWQRANDVPDVELSNNCGGANSDDPRVSVENKEAAGKTEVVIGYVDDAVFTTWLCLSTSHDIEVVDIRMFEDVDQQPEVLSRLVRIGAQPMGPEASAERPDRLPTLAPPLALSPGDWLDVDLEHRFVNCSFYSAGGSTPFDTLWVTYRIDGRERVAPVDLGTTYSVISPSDTDCPLPRDDGNGG
jgi:hypothetical protein